MDAFLSDRRLMWTWRRIFIVFAALSLALIAVVARVYYLQSVAHEDLAQRAVPVDRDFTFSSRRGSILDRNGQALAETVKAPSLFATPKKIPQGQRDRVLDVLSQALDYDRDRLSRRLDPKRSFVWVRRQLDPVLAERIRAHDLPGLAFQEEHKRYYPHGPVAGQVLGFVGVDGDGLEGVERVLDDTLAGRPIQVAGKRDVRGRMLLSNASPNFEDFEGCSVVLTLDEQLQHVAEQALSEQVARFEAKGGYAVVVDVHTGELLAVANTPRFDPNRLRDHKPGDWRLATLTDTFEPGSVIKPIVLASALERRAITLQSRFDTEEGRLKIGRHTIRDSHAHEWLDAAEVVQVSSNIGAYKIAQTVGKDELHASLKSVGFGRRTGLGIPGEQPGLLWPAKRWAEVTFANVAFGQGFTATPLQVAMSLATIANGGKLLEPRLVRQVRSRDGRVVERTETRLVRRVFSPEVARQTAWAMALVTREGGTAPQAAMRHFHVAGKTGTAQKVNPKTRRYDSKMWVASFVGFFPAERPRVLVAVMIDEPQQNHYGGVVAAPVFKQIAEEAAHILGILPVPDAERFTFPPPAPDDPEALKRQALAPPPPQEPNPLEGFVALHTPPEPDGEDAPAPIRDGALVTPDFTGLTLRGALARARTLSATLVPAAHGWGKVVSQSPEPGRPWRPEVPLVLELLPSTEHSSVSDVPSTGER